MGDGAAGYLDRGGGQAGGQARCALLVPVAGVARIERADRDPSATAPAVPSSTGGRAHLGVEHQVAVVPIAQEHEPHHDGVRGERLAEVGLRLDKPGAAWLTVARDEELPKRAVPWGLLQVVDVLRLEWRGGVSGGAG